MPDQVVAAPTQIRTAPPPPAGGPLPAPARRRRVLAVLLGSAAAAAALSVAAPPLVWLAGAGALLSLAYVTAVVRVRHQAVRREMARAFSAPGGGFDWAAFQAPDRDAPSEEELKAAANGGGPLAVLRFALACLLGWALTPAAVAIHLLAGDHRDLEGDGALARIVALQRSGRAHSLRALAVSMAASAGVTAVGGIAGMIPSPAASAAPAPRSYVVRAGDTLASIAAAHGTTVAELSAANHLADPNLILPGQVLWLGPPAPAATPAPAAPPAAAPTLRVPHAGTYEVRAGDTLASIAARAGTTWEALAAANHLADPDLILVGQLLSLDGATPAAPTSAPPTASAPAPGAVYTVRAGDTLGAIAARWGTSWEALAALNHLADPNVLFVGEVLTDVGGHTTPPVADPATAGAPAPPATPTPAPSPTGTGAGIGPRALAVALQQVGKPYQWAGAGPDTFDCSGLVRYAYAAVGVSLDHYTVSQYDETARIAETQLLPGDLVFYGGSAPSHVAMYDGDGTIVTADTTGTPVRVEPMSWDGTPSGFGRVG